MKLSKITVILATLLATTSLQAKWGRIPVMQQKPVNVAAKGPHSTVSIDSSSGVGQVDNLINNVDVTAAASFAAGKSFFIINFGKPVMVSNSSIVNDGIEGKVALSASADKNGWAVLEEKVFTAADREISFKFAGIQAKFLKYEFILSKGGTLRSLNVFGNQTDYGYALKQDPKGEKGQPMNFIGGLGGARLVYAAPKPINGIDSAATFNKFEFPETDEQYRTLIYDMGQTRIMNEFSSVHSPAPVRFEVFAFDKLPEKEDWRGRLAFNPADFNLAKPVVAYEDKVGTGHIKVKPSQPVKTRYLALRWEPDFNPPAFLIDSVGGSGNVFQMQGQQTRTVTLANGQKATVTVDPGPAVGAGTSEGTGTVTVAITNSDGTVTTTTYQGATGANITPTGIQVLSGPDPASLAAFDAGVTQQTIVGETKVDPTTNSVQMVTSDSATSAPGGGGGSTGVTVETTQTTAPDGSGQTATTSTQTNTTSQNLGNPSPTAGITPGAPPSSGGSPVTVTSP